MKETGYAYYFFCKRIYLLFLFVFFQFISYSQQVDTTITTVTDTVVSGQDSTGYYNEENEDSLKKARYNYYINREDWENDSFELRQVPAVVINQLKAQDEFWYADKEFKKEKPGDSVPRTDFFEWLSRQQWYRVLIWTIIIGGFILVLVWYLASSNASLFRRKSKTLAEAAGNESFENIFEINYQAEIDQAVQSGNYRLATRLLFLRLLKNLAEKNIIQYKQDRTNFDYLVQLNNTAYYKDFFRLARNYEYTWYGEFAISHDAFTTIKNDFDNFNNRL